MKRYIKSESRWDKYEKQGYTEVEDVGYARNKEEYARIKQKYESQGMKVMRTATDTPGLINYMVLRHPKVHEHRVSGKRVEDWANAAIDHVDSFANNGPNVDYNVVGSFDRFFSFIQSYLEDQGLNSPQFTEEQWYYIEDRAKQWYNHYYR